MFPTNGFQDGLRARQSTAALWRISLPRTVRSKIHPARNLVNVGSKASGNAR